MILKKDKEGNTLNTYSTIRDALEKNNLIYNKGNIQKIKTAIKNNFSYFGFWWEEQNREERKEIKYIAIENEFKEIKYNIDVDAEAKKIKNNELKKLISVSYTDAILYLKNKYGEIKEDYFLTQTCASPNKRIKRTKDGLVIHHIKENLVADLSKKERALLYPFEYQKGENLVYCNFLEHLILHILIVKEVEIEYILKSKQLVGYGGIVNYLEPMLLSWQITPPKLDWMNNCYKIIEKDLQDLPYLLNIFHNIEINKHLHIFKIK